MKQTAVEWLESKFDEFETIYDSLPTRLYEYVEQAKEMEKQQIIDACDSNFTYGNNGYPTLGEIYYNKTFKI